MTRANDTKSKIILLVDSDLLRLSHTHSIQHPFIWEMQVMKTHSRLSKGFVFIALVALSSSITGCLSGPPMRTRSYTWRAKLYQQEQPKTDWFVPPNTKQQQAQHHKRWKLCAQPSMRPYLEDLKKLTRRCVELHHMYHSAGATHRVGYIALLSLGMIGGAAIVSAPVFNVVKIPDTSIDPSIVLTAAGASVTAFSVLWIQTSGIGTTSNDAFQKSADLAKLIQESEVRWQNQVCHAKHTKVARAQATNLLKALASQCVKTIPKVKVNPDIFKQINRQQDNIQTTLRKYNALQQQIEQREAQRQSRKKLQELVGKIEALQGSLHNLGSARLHQRYNALESLCEQARSEHKRLQSLQGGTKTEAGSWEGICRSLAKQRQRLQGNALVHRVRNSEQRLQALITRITSLQAQSTQTTAKKDKEQHSNLTNKMLLACYQAKSEYERLQALRIQWNPQNKPLPPGSWAGSCKLLKRRIEQQTTKGKK
jgi:cell fate (sporulation/competence/biofilm development) regulator YlbF (YheA/YmcA/DUF963 family)